MEEVAVSSFTVRLLDTDCTVNSSVCSAFKALKSTVTVATLVNRWPQEQLKNKGRMEAAWGTHRPSEALAARSLGPDSLGPTE